MGRPAVSRAELLTARLDETELVRSLHGDTPASSEWFWPVSRVWGMGFSWSSFVAQATLLKVCLDAGLTLEHVLSTDGPAPESFGSAFSLATLRLKEPKSEFCLCILC